MAIILYNIKDIKRETQLVEICKDIGCHTRKLSNDNLSGQFGRLAGIAYKTPVKGTQDPAKGMKIPVNYSLPECILFAGLSDEMMEEFTDICGKSGLKSISKRAELTPANCNWSLYGLMLEIEKQENSAV